MKMILLGNEFKKRGRLQIESPSIKHEKLSVKFRYLTILPKMSKSIQFSNFLI